MHTHTHTHIYREKTRHLIIMHSRKIYFVLEMTGRGIRHIKGLICIFNI